MLGASFIDPIWAKIVAWNAEDVPRVARQSTRELVAASLKSRPDGAKLLAEFDALGDELEAAA